VYGGSIALSTNYPAVLKFCPAAVKLRLQKLMAGMAAFGLVFVDFADGVVFVIDKKFFQNNFPANHAALSDRFVITRSVVSVRVIINDFTDYWFATVGAAFGNKSGETGAVIIFVVLNEKIRVTNGFKAVEADKVFRMIVFAVHFQPRPLDFLVAISAVFLGRTC